ncbi:activating molecule in becn1-regulated autophagy protein 1 [Plakobranchus ocellatus]|uniref:Activating molecule in becn1-regulated autophagy protein 1 n=1 Tax=Plakobranchus ocellatus TaxID=259542 RepID=A0AAV3ZD82_9GAST|nr:activating molecule in becn1-regulated autophagy protein 1 [Plakobranchus ocellatus]
MCDTIRYLELRAQGLTKIPHFHQSHKRVRQLLEDYARKPVINQPCEFSGEPRATFLVDFSPNKRRAASTHGDHTVRVTDILTGKCTHILTGHPRTPWCLAFNPVSDDILASGCLGGEVRIWDLHGGGSEVLHNPNEGQVITSLAFSPAGDAVVFATLNKVYFWAWTRSKPFAVTQTKYEFERVRWLRFDPFGHYLYTGIANNSSGRRVAAGPSSVYLERQNDSASERANTENAGEQALNINRYNEVIRRYVDLRAAQDFASVRHLDFRNAQEQPGSRPSFMYMSTPRSPVNEERLNLAREYARQVRVLTSGRDTAHSGPDVLTHSRGVYSSSQAGASDTLLAPANRLVHHGLRPGTSSTEGSTPHSSSTSTARSTVSTSGFGQERRGRWGRYRPSFFSLSTEAAPHGSSDTINYDQNGGDSEDDNFGESSNIVMHWPSNEARNSTQSSRNIYQRARRPFMDSETTRRPRSPSSSHTFRPFSVRREVSVGDGLETDEFEILPVDQEQDNGGTTSRSRTEDLSTTQVLANRSPESAPDGRTGSQGRDGVSYRWDDFRSLWLACCNRSSEPRGEESASSSTESPRELASNTPANRDAGSTSSRRNDLNVGSQQPLLNSDPFMGHVERNVDFLNMMSSRASVNSTSRSRGRTRFSRDLATLSSMGNTVQEGEQAPRDNTSSERDFSSYSANAEINLRDRNEPISSSVALSSSGNQESLVLAPQRSSMEGGPDNQGMLNSSNSLGQDPEHLGPLLRQLGPVQVLDVFSQDDSVDHGVVVELTAQRENRPSNDLEATSPEHQRVDSEQVKLTTAASSGTENVLENDAVKTTEGSSMVNAEADDKKKGSSVALATRSSHAETSMSQSEPGVSESHNKSPKEVGLKAGVKRKINETCELSSVECDMPKSKRTIKTSTLNLEQNDAVEKTQEASSFATNSSKSQDNAQGSLYQHSSNLGPRDLDESVSTKNQVAVSDQTVTTPEKQESVSLSTGWGVPQVSVPCTSVPLPGVCDVNSTKTSPNNSSQEPNQRLSNSNCDVTASLTQALAAVHCSRPHVPSAGPSGLQDNPFHTLESSNLVAGVLSAAPPTLTSVTSSTAASAPPSASNSRQPQLLQLNSSRPTSAFSICCSSGQPNSTSNLGAYRASSSIFTSSATTGSLSNSRCGMNTIPSSSTACTGDPNQKRSDHQTSATLQNARENTIVPRLFETDGRELASHDLPSAGRIDAEAAEISEQGQEDQEDSHGDAAENSSALPLEERLHNLSRSVGQRVLELQRRISVLEENYRRRMRVLHREYNTRLRLTRQQHASSPSTRRRSAMLGNSRTRSTESDASAASAIYSVRRALLTDSLFRRFRTTGASAERSRTSGPFNTTTRNFSNNDSSSESNRLHRHVRAMGTSQEPELHRHHNSNNNSGPEDRYRLGIPSALLAPAPGSLPSLRNGRYGFEATNRLGFEDDQEREELDVEPVIDEGHENTEYAEHLHPDYRHSILGDSFSPPDDHLHYMMNNNIAETFLSRDEQALANNFVPQTHRIQRWSVLTDMVPDISDSSSNVVVRYCKLHNDASCCLSSDGKLLAAFVPARRGFPDKLVLGIFSLESGNFAQCLYTKSFGPNAISVSISPENSYVLVGTAARRLFFLSGNQMVGQIYKMVEQKAGENSMKLTTDLFYYPENRGGHCSVNSARWLPDVGMGLVFGTNRGDLVFSRPGSKIISKREPSPPTVMRRFVRLSDGARDSLPQAILPQFFPRRNRFANFFSSVSNNNNNANSSSAHSNAATTSRSGWRSNATQTITMSDHRSAATQTRDEEAAAAAAAAEVEESDQGSQ